jgi:hypothetical protein
MSPWLVCLWRGAQLTVLLRGGGTFREEGSCRRVIGDMPLRCILGPQHLPFSLSVCLSVCLSLFFLPDLHGVSIFVLLCSALAQAQSNGAK